MQQYALFANILNQQRLLDISLIGTKKDAVSLQMQYADLYIHQQSNTQCSIIVNLKSRAKYLILLDLDQTGQRLPTGFGVTNCEMHNIVGMYDLAIG